MVRLLSLLPLLLYALSLEAQQPFTNPAIQTYGLNEGLPHRSVYATTYDRDSLLWLTTEAMLCRFDGYRFTTFPHIPQQFQGTLRRSDSLLLFAVPFSQSDSLEIFNPHTLQSSGVVLTKGIPGAYAGAVHVEGFPLYFAQGAFIYRFRPGRSPEVIHELGSETKKGDQLLAATEDSYVMLREDKNELEEQTPLHQKISVRVPGLSGPNALYIDHEGTTWASTAEGLLRKPAGHTDFLPGPDLPTSFSINRFFEDRQGNLIFGHLDPVRLRMDALFAYHREEVYPLEFLIELDDRITNIGGTDFCQEIDLSTHGGYRRVSFLNLVHSDFKRYLFVPDVGPGEFGHVMRGFTSDDNGSVYANMDSHKPYWFRVNYPKLDLDTLLMLDEKGEIVEHYGSGTNMVTYQGDVYGTSTSLGAQDTTHMYRYRPSDDSWERFQLPSYNQRIRWILNTPRAGEFLLITQGVNGRTGELWSFFANTGEFVQREPTYPETELRGYIKSAIHDSLTNTVWIASPEGLYRYKPLQNNLSLFLIPGAASIKLSDVVLTPDHKLLIGTFEQGLHIFNPATETFSKVGGPLAKDGEASRPDGFFRLPSNDIAAARFTEQGELIVTTFNGLSIFDYATREGSTYTTADGLPSDEFNTPSLYHNPHDDRWYAGGINGFVSFRVDDLQRKPSPFKTLLLRMRYLDENLGREETATLHPARNVPLVIQPSVAYFYLDFTLPDYSVLREPRYQTKLKGFDNDWRSATQESAVRYTRLPAGEYTFQLRAIDSQGRHTENVLYLPIKVLAPWYKTGLFYTISLLAGILLLVWYITQRERRLKTRFLARRQMQDLELKALRQQINPHFISNALNAIRDFVYQEDSQQAAGYLTDFSRLMRLFLESSRKRSVTIAEETDLLRRYIRMEQLRFPNKFDYVIRIDPAIDPDMDEVPSLLLQPIVENAINHGLHHLETKGRLTIDFMLDPHDEDSIVVSVTDNGVGRKRAAALNSSSPEHISRATEILKDRSQILEQDGSVVLLINTTDLHPEKRNTGTVVTVRIEARDASGPGSRIINSFKPRRT